MAPQVTESLSFQPAKVLAKAARGDAHAVRETLARFGPIVWGLARRMTNSHADAEDAVQEIFMDLWKNAARYDVSKASEEAFVAVIARRRLIDRRRRASRRPIHAPPEQAEAAMSQAIAPGSSPETAAEAALVKRALGELRPDQREVLLLSVAQGLTHGIFPPRQACRLVP